LQTELISPYSSNVPVVDACWISLISSCMSKVRSAKEHDEVRTDYEIWVWG